MSDTPNLSELFSMLSNSKGAPIEDLFMNLMNSSSSNSNPSNSIEDNSCETSTKVSSTQKSNNISNSNNSLDTNIPDIETIMKLINIMKNANDSSPSKELLKSLKPFLNDSRKEKIDQYIKILGMTKAIEIFNELGDKPK